ncbi:MAG TPA: mechanosensitive ion channel family protein [Thermoanaerobaculia bacterium]|jgi:small-conductance mechanosensitive channel/CRP-like cAMP-binding protein|nr:mechanosensitive ion channel family protein [Thermoanaerobaculia bacterium]
MNRGARLLWPLFFAAILGVLLWAVRGNPGVIERAELDPKSLVAITRFLIYIALAFFVVRAIDTVVFDLFSRRRNVNAPVLLREIVSIILFLILIAWAASFIFDTKVTAFLAGGTVLAAVLGLALQETLGNLFAGIALHLEDSFEVGDVIHSGDYIGVVEAVRWRGTRLRTFTNSVVIVPNSVLARANLEIFPRNNLNARVLQIGIDYNVPPATALSVLTQAASNVDGVANMAPAFARVGNFGDSSVVYEIKYHMTDYSQRDRIDADIRKAVWYALRRNEIPIPFPIRTHVKYEPPAARLQPHSTEIVGRLTRIDVLSPLPPDALEAIAAATSVHTFAKGETILRHGTAGNSMFVVHDGTVSVRVSDEEVARLGEGDVFGEMALLTGENRAADVVALSEVIVIEIAKDALQPVLHDHPEFAAAISSKVMQRRDSLDSLREASNDEAEQTVLSRIRSWFSL